MESKNLVILFASISLIMVIVNLTIAYKSFIEKKNNPEKVLLGKHLSALSAAGAWVNLAYLFSLVSQDYFQLSMFSSLYFLGVSVVCFYAQLFIIDLTGIHVPRPIEVLFQIWLVEDIVILLSNPFKEIAISYIRRPNSVLWAYDMKALYQVHLIFTYLMVLTMLVLLARKIYLVPKDYRYLYLMAMIAIIFIVAMNAVYLFLPGFKFFGALDYSIWAYGIVAIFFYWLVFNYSSGRMLDGFCAHIVENVNQGIVLFDYENKLLRANEKVRKLIPGVTFDESLTLEKFVEVCRLDSSMISVISKHVQQCYIYDGMNTRTVRCDYKPIRGERDRRIIGRLFAFTDTTLERDLMTGFVNWDYFVKYTEEELSDDEFYPEHVVVCDINGLSDINSTLGRASGDRAIHDLAEAMRKFLPDGVELIRGKDAYLIAVLKHEEEKYILNQMTLLEKAIPWHMQFGIAVTTEEDPNKLHAVERAAKSMNAKKLLDQDSKHSELISSLIRALQESDPDTEAHVKRTRLMGEKLGERIGLTDEEQSRLALLTMLHDIGKIGIPHEILNKPGRLTAEEWKVMQSHVEKGYQIACSAANLAPIADMIRHHHERWDGKGYPDGLNKESIPLLSRIVSVVDSYDAMVSDRVYRAGLSKVMAIQELKKFAGSQFDPVIVAEFVRMLVEDDPELEVPQTVLTEQVEEDGLRRQMNDEEVQIDHHVHRMVFSRYTLDENNMIIDVDNAFEVITGFSQEDLMEHPMNQLDLVPEEDRIEYMIALNSTLANSDMAYFEHRIRCKDETVHYVFCYGRVFYDTVHRASRSEIIITDTSDTYAVRLLAQNAQNQAKKRLERWESKYRCDSLTGLLNQEALKSDTEVQILSGQQHVVMLMMDVDRFKQYNDTYGHRSGDEFLVMVAQALSESLRDNDLACRMGGDEFAAVLFFPEGVYDYAVRERCTQIFENINRTLTGTRGGTSLSMGAASLGNGIGSFNELYEAADQALYESKKNGRGRLYFYEREE